MSALVERCDLAPDLSIARVVNGLWQVADMERQGGKLDCAHAAAAMQSYVGAGFTTFDMADHYGSAEEIAGCHATQHGNGRDAQLLTKPGPITRADVRAAVERAIERMRTQQIDLLQHHVWSFADPAWLDALFWLQELKDEGLVRQLGVTNFDTAHLRVAVTSGIQIVSNQVSYSVIDQRAAGSMTALCLQYGIKLLAYGTVAGGFLTERWLGRAQPELAALDTWSRMKYRRFIHSAGGWDRFQIVLRTLDRIAAKHEVSIANVACRYILEQPAVCGIIIGARLGERDHLEENQRLFRFSLDDASCDEIRAAIADLQRIPGDCGDEYRKPPFLTASGDLSHHIDSMPAPYQSKGDARGRRRVLTGTRWEEVAGFSRAIRRGDRILISGTTATQRDRAIGGNDPAAQTHFVIDKIEGALQSLGSRLEDVVRTRVYVRNLGDWEPVARAHGERFRDILPVNTLVQAELVGDEYLVEIEAEALVDDEAGDSESLVLPSYGANL
jgi:aryl-alcohol dehydrogenase-like predicted oxidoreductase/enamine deaminase RidA (YjgF/YER057c/UK114 family)